MCPVHQRQLPVDVYVVKLFFLLCLSTFSSVWIQAFELGYGCSQLEFKGFDSSSPIGVTRHLNQAIKHYLFSMKTNTNNSTFPYRIVLK